MSEWMGGWVGGGGRERERERERGREMVKTYSHGLQKPRG